MARLKRAIVMQMDSVREGGLNLCSFQDMGQVQRKQKPWSQTASRCSVRVVVVVRRQGGKAKASSISAQVTWSSLMECPIRYSCHLRPSVYAAAPVGVYGGEAAKLP